MRRLRLVPVRDAELEAAGTGDWPVVRESQSLYEAVDAMLRSGTDRVTVTGEGGRVLGALSWSSIVQESPHRARGRA